ncbi:MAG: acyl-CoA dehydratase activase [Desulforhopalus sp.]
MNSKNTILGIDVGSVAAGYVQINMEGQILHKGYAFHHGDIRDTLIKLLAELDLARIGYLVTTLSTPYWVCAQRRYNNDISVITAAKKYHKEMGALLTVGGEKFSLATFNTYGQYQGSVTNTSCAAGTGSFLDQQAGRLHLRGIEHLTDIACNCSGPSPQIATRCAVFAKTDLIHAQQEGYQLSEISNGLCRGLAKNIVDTLFSSTDIPKGELIFCGGVGKNKAVAGHIEELTGLPMTIPQDGHLYGALGACLSLFTELAEDKSTKNIEIPINLKNTDDIFNSNLSQGKQYYYPPLQLTRSDYPDFKGLEQFTARLSENDPYVEIDLYHDLVQEQQIQAYLGIDIGSTSTKAVLMDDQCRVITGFYTRTAGRPLIALQNIFFAIDAVQLRKKIQFNIEQCGTTGSGRKFIGKLVGADSIIDEITAHARAACELNPAVDTIIEIGGQDAKFTTLKDGRVTFSTMNNVCAAGTGSFIEEQAAKLGCPVEEYSARAENIRAPMTSDRCTVFMERDMNHFLSEGYAINEVLASALHSVTENYLLKVATEKNIGKTIFFQGATARNKALVAAFEHRLNRPLLVSKFCHLTGALGTALILRDENQSATSFAGLDLYKKSIPITSEVCELCTNHCKISVAEVKGQSVAYGFLCGRDYDSHTYVRRKSGAIDLLQARKRLSRFQPVTRQSDLVIGLPAAAHLVDDLHRWKKFFDLLGLVTCTSEKFSGAAVKAGKKLSQAEFCAPISSMYGHARWLLDHADYIFMPLYLENKAKDARRQYCYYTQFLPALTTGIKEEEKRRFLRPVIRYLYTSFHTKMQLYRMLQGIAPGKWNFFEVASAYDRAVLFDEAYRDNLKNLYSRRTQEKTGTDISVVFLGRPYTLLSPSLNGNIPKLFYNLGIDTYYQDMLRYDPKDVATLSPLLDEIHWEHAAKILEAAEIVATTRNVYPVFVTSFKCSPDSFVAEYFKSIMDRHGKPYLILELDEHDSSVGYETRIEASIRAFRNHRGQKPRTLPIDYLNINPSYTTSLQRKHVLFPNWDRITCSLLTAALQREGYDAHMLTETDQTIRESLKHNTGQCIPLNVIAQGCIEYIRKNRLNPADCVLWLNKSTLACNIRLYPHHIKQILIEQGGGLESVAIYQGALSFSDISLRAAKNGYFAYMIGGMLRKVACKIRPYEVEKGETDRTLKKSITMLIDAFSGKRSIEKCLDEIISHFEWIETIVAPRPKVAIFGDLYSRDNRVMNQDLTRFIEANGGEVVTTPYSEYAKMIAGSYFRKWFNEGKYIDLLTSKALLTAMTAMEKNFMKIFNRILDQPEHPYDDDPAKILARYNIAPENTGESMDNILKIHYLKKFYPEVSLLVQASPALCCASLITEAMKAKIEKETGVPVVSVTYDGTGGFKNDIILPYLKYPRSFEKHGSKQFTTHCTR